MVIDRIENADRYCGMSENIDLALDYLKAHVGDKELRDGQYTVKEGEVVSVVFAKETSPMPMMEVHLKKMDIHFVLKGSEVCRFGDLSTLNGYDAQTDNCFEEQQGQSAAMVTEGMFYMVWPGEGHAPLTDVNGCAGEVKKIVMKVTV